MKITSTINYTLSVNEPNGHGIVYKADLETDVAVLMMALDVLENSRNGMKENKKFSTNKKVSGAQINTLSKTIQSLNDLTMQLCDNFERLKASAQLQEAKLAITE